VVSRSAAAALSRQNSQNDIEGLHDRLDRTDERAKDTNAKVDYLTTQVTTSTAS
jgi:hypothetical protein